jgi:hypothetical protein
MKTAIITVFQASTGLEIKKEYKGEFLTSEETKSKIIGSSLHSVFALLKVRQETGQKIFKLSESLDISFEMDGVKISTAEVRESLKVRLKLGNKAKQQRKFAQTFKAIIDYALTENKFMTLEEVIESIPAE